MNYALTVHPLSSRFRGRLAHALASEPVYLNLAELRRLSLVEAVGRLRSLEGARLVLPLEDENSRSILPVLMAVAAVSNARTVEVRCPDLHPEPLGRWQLARGLLLLGRRSATAALDAVRCRRELSRLATDRRIDARLGDAEQALYLNANLWFGVKAGGSIGHIAGVVNALRRGGCDVLYASAGGHTMIDPEVASIELRAPTAFGLPHELNSYTFHRMVVDQLGRLAAPKFVYQRLSIANYAGVALSRRWGVPLVLEYNGSETWIAKNWGRPLRFHGLATSAEAACLTHAHVVVTISEVLRDELVEKGVAPDRIVCYPNCIDPQVFTPDRFSSADRLTLRQALGVSPDAVIATFVGTFGRWHGADMLARAIRHLIDHDREWLRRTKVHFLLVGDGVQMPVVREILGEHAGTPFVTLAGVVPQAEAPAYLATSDVLLSPHVANADGSRFFGSPTKLFEYMAMGKAIVASDLDQIGQVLRHSLRTESLPAAQPTGNEPEVAVLAPPGNVAALVRAIKFMVESSRWRQLLGRNARAEVLAKYTWTHHTAAILNRLDSILN